MGRYTQYTRRWLERRFAARTSDGLYFAHQPIYGVDHPASEPGRQRRLARTFQILRTLARLRLGSVVDVGAGEGFLVHLARRELGCDVLACDLSVTACRRAAELFDLPSLSVSGHALPFPDGAFDVVVCSEMIEHVEHPVEVVLELLRVARRAVVLTTEELETDREAIDRWLFRRCGYPHFERNVFHPDDLRLLLGPGTELRSQFRGVPPREPVDADTARRWIAQATDVAGLAADGTGVIALACRPDVAAEATPRVPDARLLDAVLEPAVPPRPPRPRHRDDPLAGLAGRAVCPACGGGLRAAAGGPVRCGRCEVEYDVRDGVADLAPAPEPSPDGLQARLLRAWDDPRRAARACELRARLELPSEEGRRAWDFRRVADRRGWMPNDQLQELPGAGFAFRSLGSDPWLVGPGLELDGPVRALEIVQRLHNPDYPVDAGSGQVFWLGIDEVTFTEECSAKFALINDGEVHRYVVDLAGAAAWPADGDVMCVRLDPADGPGELELLEVRFV